MDPNVPNASLLVGPPAKIEGWRWWIIWLLFFATSDHIQTPFGKFAPVLIAVGFLPLLVAFLALAWPRAPGSSGSCS
jgi:hypothetical protein